MKILLQKNIWHEHGYNRLVQSFKDQNIECDIIHIIPFTTHLEREIDYIPTHSFGSNRFIHICRERGYHVFPSFKPIEAFYPNHLWINSEGIAAQWGNIKTSIIKPTFIKPFREKFFTGRVILDQDDLEKVQLSTSFIDNEDDEWVWLSPAVEIQEEIRFFILGGQIATGSGYRIKGQSKHYKIDQIHPAWLSLQNIIRQYGHIADGYVIDLGLVDGEWKIVELNNLNSSGIYESDTDALVRSLIHL